MLPAVVIEQARLSALKSYKILDTPPEADFDRLTKLAANVCETPIAMVTFVDKDRQWFKSVIGLDLRETPRSNAFCAHAIGGENLFVVSRTQKPPLFAKNPLVVGNPSPCFYAGMPLISPSGYVLGTLAVMDHVPRTLTCAQEEALEALAKEVMAHLEFRRLRQDFQKLTLKLKTSKKQLHKLGTNVSRLNEANTRINEQASLLDKAQDAIVVRGIDHRILFWNKGAERIYGFKSEEVVGSSVVELLYDDPASFFEIADKVLEFGEWSGEITQRRKDGSAIVVEGHWTLVRDDDGQPQSILAINTDLTQRKAAEHEIHNLAFYDPLTRLPNRQLLLDRLQQSLVVSARSKQTGALLFIDLDNFKTLNESLGHDMGDLLLEQVAQRIINCLRKSDTVARLGGDEFVALLENLSEDPRKAAAKAKIIGEKILACFNKPYQLADYEHYSTPSIGIALFNGQHSKVEELLKHGDLAMYEAKASGRNALRFFDVEMQATVSARVALETDLRKALRKKEFYLHYQPQVDGTGFTTGAEALLRWQQPQRGFISPAEFIPLAEETGLILPLGEWVLETACAQLVKWSANSNTEHLTMAVNVSSRQFRQPEFVEQVLKILKTTGANPNKLKLELTESLLVEDMQGTIAKMACLKTKGVGFALDDFGTGFSSLSYLKRLPLDQLKIDQSFVIDVMNDPNDAAIARTIVALAKSLGLTVIAEGVETEEQRNFLASHGCNDYQGYLFSRPLPADQFSAFIKAFIKKEK